MKMKPKILSYDETCINKNAFHKETNSISIDEVEIDKITLLHKPSYGKYHMVNKGSFKYHTGYRHKNEDLLSPLNIKLPQLTGYTKHFNNNNKYVSLLVNDKKIIKQYNEIWNYPKAWIKS